jgi:hypothetical protein
MPNNMVSVPAKGIPAAPSYGTGPKSGTDTKGSGMTSKTDSSTLAAANSKAAPTSGVNSAPKGFNSGLINGKV